LSTNGEGTLLLVFCPSHLLPKSIFGKTTSWTAFVNWFTTFQVAVERHQNALERLDLTAVAGARTLKARVKRGETLPVLVTLQNIQGVRETASFNLAVPPSARVGKATLMIGDGFSLISADPDERAVEMNGLPDMLRVLNGAMKNNHVYGLLVQAVPGAGLRGARIEGVPPTVSSLLESDGDAAGNRLQRQIISRAVLPLEREVRGLVSLDLEIE